MDLGLPTEAVVSGQGGGLGRPSPARRWLQRGTLVVADSAAAAFADWLQRVCRDELAAALRALPAVSP